MNLLEQRRQAIGVSIEELSEATSIPYQRLRRHLYGESGGTLSRLESATAAMTLALGAKARLDVIIESLITSQSQDREILEAKRTLSSALLGVDPDTAPFRGESYNDWHRRMQEAQR